MKKNASAYAFAITLSMVLFCNGIILATQVTQTSRTVLSSGIIQYPRLGGLRVIGNQIVDQFGVETTLMGCGVRTNLRDPRLMFTQQIAYQLASLGFNAVRVPIYGEFIMPSEGLISNSCFENYVDEWVNYCENAGLYCILDMHQDHWSQYFDYEGWGEGFPAWMFASYPNTHQGQIAAVNDFYQGNGPSSNNASYFIEMWQAIAFRYRDRQNVLFGLLNEPLHYDSDLENNIPAYCRLMEQTINAIRPIETFPHIVLLGWNYGEDYLSLFSDVNDTNVAWSGSEYFLDPVLYGQYVPEAGFNMLQSAIQARVERFCDVFGKPLVATETGALFNATSPLYCNKLLWFSDVVKILKEFNMSICFWRWEWNSLVLADGVTLNQDILTILRGV